ncbi:MAG: FecR domain-containing protein, partial [Pseudomonadota bacterium]
MLDNPSDPKSIPGLDAIESAVSLSTDGEPRILPHIDGSSGDFVQIANPSLLFLGDYARAGDNLVLSHDGKVQTIEGFFDRQDLPSLQAPNGAFLDGDTIAKLAGLPFGGMVAQAGGGAPVEIGKVVKLEGTATSTNAAGTQTELAIGTPVFQGDIIQTGAGSKLGINFIDKTVFSLSANARMVLDELVFDPNQVENSSMNFNLVQGAFVFVTGDIAPTGNMKIDTPVATMGIRGTTPRVFIDASLGVTEFTILPDPDSGNVGNYVILNKTTGAVLGTVTSTADKWVVTTLSNEAVRINKTGLDLLEDQIALDEIRDVFSKASGDRTEIDGTNSFTRIGFNPLTDGGDGGPDADPFGDNPGGTDVVVDGDTSADDPPEAADDLLELDLDGQSPLGELDLPGNVIVLDNGLGVDIDPEGFPLNVTQINGQDLIFDNGVATVELPSTAILEIAADGTITYAPGNAYDFLGLGDQDTDIFTYTISDVSGQTDIGTISIGITGNNQSPEVIFNAVQSQLTSLQSVAPGGTDLEESFTELTDRTADLTVRAASGVIEFRDLDASDVHVTSQADPTVVWNQDGGGTEQLAQIGSLALSISATAPDPNPVLSFTTPDPLVGPPVLIDRPPAIEGEVSWTYTVVEQAIDFLAHGETLVLTYPVSITDDSGADALANTFGSATTTVNVVVTITGTNDQPQIIATTDVTEIIPETNAGLTTSGSFDIQDVDVTDVVLVTGVTVATSGQDTDAGGAVPSNAALDAMFSVSSDATPQIEQIIDGSETTGTIDWSFDSGGEAFDYLAVGESLVLTYTVTVDDGEG